MIWEARPVGPLEINCYLVGCPETRQGIVFDAGAEAPWIIKRIKELGLDVKLMLNTHGHLDHIGAVDAVREATGAPFWIHPADVPMLQDPRLNLSAYMGKPITARPPDGLLTDGQEFQVGTLRIRTIHTPGHTPGGVVFLVSRADQAGGAGHLEPVRAITGDTLFAGSVGRTDFPGGSHEQLIASIRTKLFTLGDAVEVHPGHGPSSTIGDERAFNPYVRG